MDLKVAAVIFCLCALAITEAGIPRCCIKTTKVSMRFLKKVERWYVQPSSGVCDISALILYVKGRKKPFCAPVEMKAVVEIIQKNKMEDNF